ncbi:MAG: Ig-like domain-containing protein [Catonella sp.]|nr:Ig-like domain-containing protein [Catonella sp.]
MEKKHEKKRTWRKNLAVLLVFTLVLTIADAYGTEGVFKGMLGGLEAKAASVKASDYRLTYTVGKETKSIQFTGENDYEFVQGTTQGINVNVLTLQGPESYPDVDNTAEITFADGSNDTDVCKVEVFSSNNKLQGIKITAKSAGNVTVNMQLAIGNGEHANLNLTIKVPILVNDSPKYSTVTGGGYSSYTGDDKNITKGSVPCLILDKGITQVSSFQLSLIGEAYAKHKFAENGILFSLSYLEENQKDNVITVNGSGNVTPNGAGISSISIKRENSKGIEPANVNVVVPLKVSKNLDLSNPVGDKGTDSKEYISSNITKDNLFVYWAAVANNTRTNSGVSDTGALFVYSNLYTSGTEFDKPSYSIERYNTTASTGQGNKGNSEFETLTDPSEYGFTDAISQIVNEGKGGVVRTEFNISTVKVGFYKVIMTVPDTDINKADGTADSFDKTVRKYITETFYIRVNAIESTEIVGMVKGGAYNPMSDETLHTPDITEIGIKVYLADKKGSFLTTTASESLIETVKDHANQRKIRVKKNGKYKVVINGNSGLPFTYQLKAILYVGTNATISPIKKTIYIGESDTLRINTTAVSKKDNSTDYDYDPDKITWELEDGGSKYLSVEQDEDEKEKATITGLAVKEDSKGKPTYVTVIGNITINHAEIPVEYRVTVREPKETPQVTLVPSTSMTIKQGETVTMAAILVSQSAINVEDTSISWKSSDTTIATVQPDKSDNGQTVMITGIAPGTVTIIATNSNNGTALATAKITVKMPVGAVKITDQGPIVQAQGTTYQLHWTVTPVTAEQGVTFKSSNTAIATVNDRGLITFVKGTVTPASITVTSKDDTTKSDSIEVVCTTPQAGVTLDKSELTLNVGETYNFKIKVNPTDASDKSFKVSSSDEQVGTISADGTFTALQAGNTVVTVTTSDGKYKATCKVTVKQNSTGIALDASELNLNVGDTYTLKVTFTPATTTETGLIWSSDDDTVATVEDGTVTAVGVGECEVSASTTNGNTARCKVTVYQALGGMSLNETEITVDKGDTFQLEVIFDPDDTTNQEVTWTSSKDGVATVSSDGLVTGVSGGLAIVTATSDDGNYTAQCVVTVMEYAAKLTVKPKSKIMEVGDTLSLTVTASPASVTNKKVTYSSNKKSVATVNKSGVVTAKKVGTATITVKTTDGSGATTKCTIKVVKRASSLSLNRYLITMVVGRTTTLKGTVRPKTATVKSLRYKSSDENIVYVTGSGKLTALKTGEATITVSTKDGSGLSKKCKVIVRDYVAATKLSLSATDMTLSIGDKQAVTYSLTPNNTDDKVTWSSNNRRAASVGNNSGIISANSPGQAVITGSTTSGLTATLTVTVVGLSFYTLNMEQYDIYSLSVLGGTTATVSWDTSNASIATVDANGQVTAKKAGRCYIYARVNGALLRCRVTVRNIR